MAMLVAAFFLLKILARPSEPIYQGKRLSYWIAHLDGAEAGASRDAIRDIGSPAVPYMLDQIRLAHSAGQRFFALIWPRLPIVFQRRLSPPKVFQTYGNPDVQIVRQLNLLSAQAAMPGLIDALSSRNNQVQITALAAIIGFGERTGAALPVLAKLLKHPNGFVRRWAVLAMGSNGANRTEAIPALISALKDSDTSPLPGSPARVRQTAAHLLGLMGTEAAAACADLSNLLQDSDGTVRTEAAIALWRICRDTTVVPVLRNELEKGDNYTDRAAIVTTLGEMGTFAIGAAPALRNLISPPYHEGTVYMRVGPAKPTSQPVQTMAAPMLPDLARDALRKIDPQESRTISPTLFDKAPGLFKP